MSVRQTQIEKKSIKCLSVWVGRLRLLRGSAGWRCLMVLTRHKAGVRCKKEREKAAHHVSARQLAGGTVHEYAKVHGWQSVLVVLYSLSLVIIYFKIIW